MQKNRTKRYPIRLDGRIITSYLIVLTCYHELILIVPVKEQWMNPLLSFDTENLLHSKIKELQMQTGCQRNGIQEKRKVRFVARHHGT